MNVGNLPPRATVLIKITYVAELVVDGEHICFALPGTVAPWTREKALDDVTQVDMVFRNVDLLSLSFCHSWEICRNVN